MGELVRIEWGSKAAGLPGRSPRLRAHIFGLVLLALLPAAAAAIAAVFHAAATYRALIETRLQNTTAALAVALDSEIERIRPLADMLARSPILQQSDQLETLYSRAARLAEAYETRIWMRGPGPAHELLFSTASPLGVAMDAELPRGGAETLARAAIASRSVVGSLNVTALLVHSAAIVAPVFVEDRLHGFIGLSLPLERLAAVLSTEGHGGTGRALLIDDKLRVVTSSRDPHRDVGRPAPAWYGAAIAGHASGLLDPPDGDGPPLVHAFARLPNSPDWTVLVTEPGAFSRGDVATPLLGLAAGVLLAVVLGLAGAALLATRLLRTVRATLRTADLLAQGVPPVAAGVAARRGSLRVAEFEELRAAHLAIAAERARHAEAAARERSLLLAVVEGTGDPVWIRDRSGSPLLLNSAAGRLLAEAGSERFLGAMEEATRHVLAAAEPQTLEVAVEQPGAGSRIHLVLLAPWREPGGGAVLGVVGVARDVTSMRESEARLRETERSLQHLARRVTSEAMANGVAHELSQPLAAANALVGTALTLLRQGGRQDGADRLHDALCRLSAQLNRAGAIIRNFRGFLGRREDHSRRVAPGAIVQEAVDLALAGGLPQPQVPVEVAVAPDLPNLSLRVVAVQQVVVNLVRNAVEAASAGPGDRAPGVRLEVSGVPGDGAAVQVQVSDTGPGLAPEAVAHLFQPFHSTKRDGLGLGLSICRTIVEAHGGRIGAAPAPGGGTVFTFTLRDIAPGAFP
jgi:C4-dicarboxylate-specific signal transduction histidine kinase